MASPHAFSIGDWVIVDPAVARASHLGVVYRVTRLLPVNVVVEPDGGGRALLINPIHLRPAPDSDSPTRSSAAVTAVTVPYEAPLDQGTLLTVAGPRLETAARRAVRGPARQRRRPHRPRRDLTFVER